jgi:putative ABC transport system permease protein
MVRNYLLIAFRTFQRNKVFSFINIIGLAVGMATSSLIFLYVFDELAYDSIHERHENLYSIGVSVIDKTGNKESFGVAPGGWPIALQDKFQNVKTFTRLLVTGFPHTIHDKRADRIVLNQDGELYWVENTLTDVLRLEMLGGSGGSNALEHINSMIVSVSAAKSLFGNESAVGRSITIKHPFTTFDKEVEYEITGVFKDYPSNTFFRPKYLLNINGLKTIYEANGTNFSDFMNGNSLNGGFFFTFLFIPQNADLSAIKSEMDKLAAFTTASDSTFRASGSKVEAAIRPFDEMHFDSQFNWAVFEQAGNKQTVYVLAGIGLLILVIASINYMNLATARSGSRGKEVGLRKTLGSRRRDIAFQFIQESAINTIAALLLAMILVFLALPYFNQLAGKHFDLGTLSQMTFLLTIVCIVIIVTLLGGSYPAFYLSSFKPSEVLKGKSGGKGSETLRKSLVTFQFASAVVLTISSMVILDQMELIQQSKLNESGKRILSVRYGTVAPNEKYPVLKNELLQDKDLSFVTMGNHLPRHDYFGGIENTFRFAEIDDKEYQWARMGADFDFCRAFDIQLVSGRDFDINVPSDSNTILVNERAAKVLNKNSDDILGVQVEDMSTKKKSTVIGVVKDFPFQSAYHAINPLIISPKLRRQDRILYVRLPLENVAEKIHAIEETWKRVMPGVGFDYWFVDDEFRKLYKKENQVSGLAKWFSMLSLSITILGLYGLSSYMAEQKTKEVGIRKALGASSGQIVYLFMMTFLKMFLMSLLIALPAAWYFSNEWLNTFIFRIGLTPQVFLAGTAAIFLLMMLTVGYEVMRASRANPINALKHE